MRMYVLNLPSGSHKHMQFPNYSCAGSGELQAGLGESAIEEGSSPRSSLTIRI